MVTDSWFVGKQFPLERRIRGYNETSVLPVIHYERELWKERHLLIEPANYSEIDETILAVTPAHWAKVAFVIGRVDQALRNNQRQDIELDSIAKRIEALIQDGRLAAQGNVKKWRYSEVRKLDRSADR